MSNLRGQKLSGKRKTYTVAPMVFKRRVRPIPHAGKRLFCSSHPCAMKPWTAQKSVESARDPKTPARRGFVAGLRNAGVNVIILARTANTVVYETSAMGKAIGMTNLTSDQYTFCSFGSDRNV